MSFRTIVSLITFVAIVIVLYFSRHELVSAWELLAKVNLWILVLLIPAQFISYFAVGEMIFEYLRAKGDLKHVNKFTMTRMALELNFVNHALPSGGVSGFSYLGWRLKHLGVNPARSTLAQVLRFAMTYIAFLLLLAVSVLAITVDTGVNRFAIYISSVLATAIILGTLFVIYIVSNYGRLHSFSWTLTKFLNKLSKRFGLAWKYRIDHRKIQSFFEDLHRDFVELKHERGLLKKPFWWGLVFNIFDIGMFVIAFAALGVVINPAMIVIAYGIAALAAFFMFTPGGTGLYELIMVWFLTSAGAPADATIAAIVLSRTILVLGTIVSGYIFYQLAILKYGKRPATR